MNKLQKRLLVLYKELKILLEENHIKFFAIGGTAIGACREKGFIEWDDDIDLAITEDDLTKFKKAVNTSKFSFASRDVKNGKIMDRTKLTYFFKVYDKNTWVNENGEIINISIDVMVAQKQRYFSKLDKFRYTYYHILAHAKRNPVKAIKRWDGVFVAFGYSILKLFYFWMSPSVLEKRMKNLLFSRKIINKDDYYAYHVRFDEYWNVHELINHKFEDTVIPVTKTFKTDIFHIFGDIYEIPKDSEKGSHRVVLFNE